MKPPPRERPPTQLAGSLDVDVVIATPDADDDPQSLELLQVLPGERDGVVHHGAHCLVKHLQQADSRGSSG